MQGFVYLSLRQSKGHSAALRHPRLTWCKNRNKESSLTRNQVCSHQLTSMAWRSEMNVSEERILLKSSGGSWQGSILEHLDWLFWWLSCFWLLQPFDEIFILFASSLFPFLFLLCLLPSSQFEFILDDVLGMSCARHEEGLCSFAVNIRDASLLFFMLTISPIPHLIWGPVSDCHRHSYDSFHKQRCVRSRWPNTPILQVLEWQ